MKGELNMLGVHVLSVRKSSVLEQMIGVQVGELKLGVHVLSVRISSVLEQMIGVQVISFRTISALIHMIGAHLLSVQVVYW